MKRTITTSIMLFVMLLFAATTSVAHANGTQQLATSTLPIVADGSAYAAFLKVPVGSALASIGPLFPVNLGCNVTARTVTSSAASLSLGSFATSGSLVDQVTTTRTATAVTSQASSTLQNVSVLGGLISATTISSVATSTGTATSLSSTNNSTFVGLSVLGVPFVGTPSPNTTIALPGLGSVTLNEQIPSGNNVSSTDIRVIAIDVKVTLSNIFGLPVGAHIIIASAASSLQRTSSHTIVDANAYGLFAFAKASVVFVKSGPFAEASIGCTGGTKTVSVASVNVPNIGSTGTMTDTATGSITASGATSQGSSTVQGINLLSGLITANVITSTAQAGFNGSFSHSGTTSLVNLLIAGVPIAVNPAPNTKINIPGVGFVVLNEQTVSQNASMVKIGVNAIDLHITVAGVPGLPVGVRVVVGHSSASANTFV